MKNLLIILAIILTHQVIYSQGSSCQTAEPFCTGSTYTFPAGVNSGNAPAGNNYGCLGSTPNPAWYYLEIDQGGSLTINMTNSANRDIDYILYGPYTSVTNAQSYCGSMGVAGSGAAANGIVDCSFNPQANESATISNAQSGQVYVLLITNFSNQNTNISFTNSAGSTATTNCSIVEPCVVTSLDAVIGGCNPATGNFNVTGTVAVQDPPGSGTLIAVDCNGNQTTIASSPFTNNSYSFALNDITADGVACNLRVYFSADPSCELAVNYNNPPSCELDCGVTYLEVNAVLPICATQWEVEGQVEYLNEPSTGQLIVQDCEGNQVVVATAPFPPSPVNYSFLSAQATESGGACQYRAYFTTEPSCELILSLDYPGSTLPDASFTYPEIQYCQSDSNPAPVITGTPGGTFTSTSGLVINPNTGVINLSSSQPGTYVVNYETASCGIQETFTITIHPLPNVFAGNDVSICEGQSVVLTGTGATTYSWDNGIVNGTSFTPTSSGTYTVTGTSNAGCVNTDQVTVTVVSTPVVSFTGNDLTGCSPHTVTFNNTSTGNIADCVWDLGNGINQVGCNNITQTYTTLGCYNVTLTVSTPEGCSNSLIISNYVCVDGTPIADFTASPSTMSSVEATTTFVNSSSGATSYSWDFGDGNTSTSNSPTHTYEEAGVYTVTLTAYSPEGCIDITTQVVTVTDDLIFYVPNAFTPDNDEFNEVFKPIFTSGFDIYNYNLLIFNRWGEVVFESNNAEVGWDGTYGGKIVQDGTYIWRIVVKRTGVDDREQYTGHVNLLR